MVPLDYLSLTCRSTPHRRAHKKAVLPTPGLFIERSYAAVLFNNLCRKQREPDLHCINKKKTGIPAQPVLLFHTATNTSHTTPKKHNKKLVLICPPSLYPQPPGPGPKTSSPGCLGDGWQKIKKNKVFRVLVIWVNHLIANCVCGTSILQLVLRREPSIQYDIVLSKVRQEGD